MPRLLPKYLWILPEYSQLLHNNLASSAPRVSLPRVPGVPCGGSASAALLVFLLFVFFLVKIYRKKGTWRVLVVSDYELGVCF